ncbi:carbohydrate esterase family 5 protein [Thermothelomyces heterothallicus CBS 203.75]
MWPTPKVAYLLLAAHSLLVSGTPVDAEAVDAAVLAKRQCPQIHIFGARETTAPPGYGTAGTVVNLILNAYGDSARQGTDAVASAVNSFNQRCPNTQIVLVGYSQGGQIIDNAVCGGPDTGSGITTTTPPISAAALNQIKAVIEMGSPRFVAGLSYDVGTCTAQGFAARPRGYVCGSNSASKIQSYCDSTDPYCCTGNDANSHQQYGNKYGQQALDFVKARLSGSGGTPTSSAGGSVPTGGNGGTCSPLYGQCGGQGWTGPTCCSQGTCRASNQWYSQCL